MKRLILLFFVLSFSVQSQIKKVEPPYWWTGMQDSSLEIMIYGENISEFTPSINNAKVTLVDVKRTDNTNYIFLNLDLSQSQPGVFKIKFSAKKKRNNFSITYELKQKRNITDRTKGFDSTDVIYLITPDRFANADESNDIVKGLQETKIDRQDNYARHGGDIKGITNHLDYIAEMGFTAIWPTPLLVNDMKESSYHGYAITDLYQADPRFGTLTDYVELATKSREKGIKLIMDQVNNHIGLEHWWMKDLPDNDWINNQKLYEDNRDNWNWKVTKTSNHRRTTNQDMYASKIDKKEMTEGWFVSAMPDLNQRNPQLAKYLIQNSIWWIETLNLGGIRQDTYPYSDKEFMANWAGAIIKEYPNFSIVGEEWSTNPLVVGYWQDGAKNKDGYTSHLSSTMDFPLQKQIVNGINESESWDTGFVKMYEGLANDFSYANPNDIMIFPDNHDMDRIFTQFNKDVVKTKMALTYMAVLPRILQIYYGTEILLENSAKPGDYGLIRADFPGGWQHDKTNAFTRKGLTTEQLDMQLFLKKVLNYRKNSAAIHTGKTIHFAPKEGIYVLFRIKKDEIVTIILNKNNTPKMLNLNRFNEIGLKDKTVKNIITGSAFIWSDTIELKTKGVLLLTTKI